MDAVIQLLENDGKLYEANKDDTFRRGGPRTHSVGAEVWWIIPRLKYGG